MVDEKYEQNMLRLLVFVVLQYVPGNRSRSLMFQFHRLWNRSQS